jgi:hypothetical protein
MIEFNVLVRKHGRGRRYRGTLDPQQRTLQLRSITSPACYSDDPICNGEPNTPECSLTDEACQYGHYDVSGTESVHLENPPELSEAWYDAGPYICPAYVDDPEFVYKGRLFQLEDVRIFRVGFLPMTSGIPKARYQIPQGEYTSDDGTLRIYSGTVDGTCFVSEQYVLGFRIQAGYMAWYKFQGVSRDLTVGSGQAQDGVWVSYGGNGGGSYMDPEAARVLERYMNEGLCTPGWMIFVDGAQVC